MKLAIVFSGQSREWSQASIYNAKRLFPYADFYYGVYDHESDNLPINDTSSAVFFPEPQLPEGHIWWHNGRKPDCEEYERVLRDKVMVDEERWNRRRHQSKQFYNHFYTTKHFKIHERYDRVLKLRYDSIFDMSRESEIIQYFKECFKFDGLWGFLGSDEIADTIDGRVRIQGEHREAVNDQVFTYPSNHFCDEDTIFELYHKNQIPPVEWGLYRLATEHIGPESSGKVVSSITPLYTIGRSEEWLALAKKRNRPLLPSV